MSNVDMSDWDTAPGGFLVFSEMGIIVDLNTTLLNWLNYPDKNLLIGQKTAIIFSIADRIFHQTHFLPLLRMQGHADEIFFRLKTNDGNELPVICNAVRKVRGDEARIHCIFISAVQRSKYEQELLTTRKEAQEALAQNSALLGAQAELEEKALSLDENVAELKKVNEDLVQFGKVISHDLQEPIRKIAVFSDKVARDGKHRLDEGIIRQFEKIKRECLILRQLGANLERFISLSLHTGESALVDLNEVVEVAFRTSMENEVEPVLQLAAGPLPSILGDQRQLEMLFYNVFKNSRQFRAADRPLTIAIEHVIFQQNIYRENRDAYLYADFVRIIIHDNGRGFDYNPEINYFGIQKKAVEEGIGLTFGLAFVNKVASNHHGSASIKSTTGKGTSVILSLPIGPKKGN